MTTSGASAARVRAAARLAAAGVPSPQFDAAELLAHVLGISRGMLPTVRDLDDAAAQHYEMLLARRIAREPLQYIVGSAGFYGLDLHVGPGVFIPRPETELLVEAALSAIAGRPRPSVVDLCSGSGAIAVAIAAHRRDARVIAVERSADALTWLCRNVEEFAPQVSIVQADAVRWEPDEAGGVDLVTCNPPYVPEATRVDREVAAHDPHDAVFSGADGLGLIRPLLGTIAALLRAGGTMLLEHDATHQRRVIELAERTGAFGEIEPLDDLSGRPRFVRARRG